MADTKISALPASTTPLAGTEVLPIVQSSTTKQVSVANLTAGRAISATQLTLTTGNVIVANGQGVDFSATPGTGTSELLADYEEGTWTPVLTGDTSSTGITYAAQTGRYVKIGNLVTVDLVITLATKTLIVGSVIITGVPYAGHTNSNTAVTWGYWNNLAANWMSVGGWLNGGNTIYLGGRSSAGSGIQTMANSDIASNTTINCSITYKVA